VLMLRLTLYISWCRWLRQWWWWCSPGLLFLQRWRRLW